jgi:hypothetical protein
VGDGQQGHVISSSATGVSALVGNQSVKKSIRAGTEMSRARADGVEEGTRLVPCFRESIGVEQQAGPFGERHRVDALRAGVEGAQAQGQTSPTGLDILHRVSQDPQGRRVAAVDQPNFVAPPGELDQYACDEPFELGQVP